MLLVLVSSVVKLKTITYPIGRPPVRKIGIEVNPRQMPLISLVLTFFPNRDICIEHIWWVYHFQSVNVISKHVIIELQTPLFGQRKELTLQDSIITGFAGFWGLDVHEKSWKSSMRKQQHIIENLSNTVCSFTPNCNNVVIEKGKKQKAK